MSPPLTNFILFHWHSPSLVSYTPCIYVFSLFIFFLLEYIFSLGSYSFPSQGPNLLSFYLYMLSFQFFYPRLCILHSLPFIHRSFLADSTFSNFFFSPTNFFKSSFHRVVPLFPEPTPAAPHTCVAASNSAFSTYLHITLTSPKQ